MPSDANGGDLATLAAHGTADARPGGGVLDAITRLGRRWRLTRDGWICVGATGWAAFAAASSNSTLMLLICCLIAALLVVGLILPGRVLRRVTAHRRIPEFAIAGRHAEIAIEVRNAKRLFGVRAVSVRQYVRGVSAQTIPPVYVDGMAAGAVVTQRQRVIFPTRGRVQFDHIELATRYPFGFLERCLSLAPQCDELVVYPRLGKLKRSYFEMDAESHPEQSGHQPQRCSQPDDFHGLREFRYGDTPRWIHWATTARRGLLMVKEFEVRRNRDVAIFLDAWQPARPDTHYAALLERAISFAATLIVEICRQPGIHLLLAAASDPPILLHGASSLRLARQALQQLADVRGTAAPDWGHLVELLQAQWISHSRVTAITLRPLDALVESLDRAAAGFRRWERVRRDVVYVDVGSASHNEYFHLE